VAIRNGGDVTTTSGSVELTALDDAQIVAVSGVGVLGIQRSGGLTVSAGASGALNIIHDTARAWIDEASVTAVIGDVRLSAKSTATIYALTAAGSLSTTGQSGGAAFGGVFTVSINTIVDDVEARISGSSVVRSGPDRPVQLTADDHSVIRALAGSPAADFAGNGVAAGGGAAAAINVIHNTTLATIDQATVHAGGAVHMSALAGEQINAGALAISGFFAGGQIGGIALAEAGSVCGNVVNNLVQAEITGGSTVTGNGVWVSAKDSSTINMLAGALTGGASGLAPAVGFSLAVNVITNTVDASIDGSAVCTLGGLSLSAVAKENILVTAVPPVGVVGAGWEGFGVALSGTGALTVNIIHNTVAALITGSRHIDNCGSQNLQLTAEDDSTLLAFALAGSGAVAGGAFGVGGAVAASVVFNVIHNSITANIDNAAVQSAGEVVLAATSAAMVVGLAAGVAGALSGGEGFGFSPDGAGSAAVNWIWNRVKAAITGGSSVTTSGGAGVSLAATDNSIVAALGGAGAVGGAAGFGAEIVGVGVSLGFALAANDIGDLLTPGLTIPDVTIPSQTISLQGIIDVSSGATTIPTPDLIIPTVNIPGGTVEAHTVEALIDNSTVISAGGVSLDAHSGSLILAGAGGANASLAGGGFTGAVDFGAAVSFNAVHTNTLAHITGGSNVSSSTGPVQLTATHGGPDLPPLPALPLLPPPPDPTTLQNIGSAIVDQLPAQLPLNLSSVDLLPGCGLPPLPTPPTPPTPQDIGRTLLAIPQNAGIIAIALAGSGSGAASNFGGGSGGAAGAGAANDIVNSVTANIDNSTVSSGGNVGLKATSGSLDLAVGVGAYGTAAVSKLSFGVSFAGVGSGAVNTVTDTVAATITQESAATPTNVTTTNGGFVTLLAENDSIIAALAGSGAGAVGVGIGTAGGAPTLGFSVAFNLVPNTTVQALVDGGATVNAAGAVLLQAQSNAKILAATVAGGVAASGGTWGGVDVIGLGDASVNTVEIATTAQIRGASTVGSGFGWAVELKAEDDATVAALAGAVSGGGAGGVIGGAFGGVGAAFAVNGIDDTVTANIDNSTVNSGLDLGLFASSTMQVLAAAVGASGGADGGVGGGLALGGALSGGGNTLTNTIEASITRKVPTSFQPFISAANLGILRLSATDNSKVEAITGSLQLAGAVGLDLGVPGGVGIAASGNSIADRVVANIDESNVVDAGDVVLAAKNNMAVEAFALGIAGAVVGTGTVSLAFPNAGSIAVNNLTDTVQASIDGSSVTASGAVTINATDNVEVKAGAGAGVLSLAIGSGSTTLSFEASIAQNHVVGPTDVFGVPDFTVLASIGGGSVVSAAGSVSLSAKETGCIVAATGSGAGEVGEAFLVGSPVTVLVGAVSNNIVANRVAALITGGSKVPMANDVHLTATDSATITAFGLGIAATTSAGLFAPPTSLVGAWAHNYDSSSVTASIDGASVSAASLDLSAKETGTASATTFAVAFAGGMPAVLFVFGVAIPLDAAGSWSSNLVANTIEASIKDGSSVTTSPGGVNLDAEDDTTVKAEARGPLPVDGPLPPPGSVGAAFGFGLQATSGAVGDSYAHNDVGDTVVAKIDRSSVRADGGIDVSALGNQSMDAEATALALSGGITLLNSTAVAVGVGWATNSVHNEVAALIGDGPLALNETPHMVTAGGSIQVTANDLVTPRDSPINATAAAGALSGAISLSSGTVSFGLAYAANTVIDNIHANVDNVQVISDDGDITVSAQSGPPVPLIPLFRPTPTIHAQSFAAAIALPLTGLSIGLSIDKVTATNIVADTVAASITNGSTVDAGQSVTVAAKDHLTVTAQVNALGGSLGALALAFAFVNASNFVTDTVWADVDNSSVTGPLGISVTADGHQTVTAPTYVIAAVTPVTVVSGAAAFATASSDIEGSVEAFVNNAPLSAAIGAVNVAATSVLNSDASTQVTNVGSFGLPAFSFLSPQAKIFGITRAHADGVTTVSAGQFNITANATHTTNASAGAFSLSFLPPIDVPWLISQQKRDTEAFIAPNAVITANGAAVAVNATSHALIQANASGVEGLLVDLAAFIGAMMNAAGLGSIAPAVTQASIDPTASLTGASTVVSPTSDAHRTITVTDSADFPPPALPPGVTDPLAGIVSLHASITLSKVDDNSITVGFDGQATLFGNTFQISGSLGQSIPTPLSQLPLKAFTQNSSGFTLNHAGVDLVLLRQAANLDINPGTISSLQNTPIVSLVIHSGQIGFLGNTLDLTADGTLDVTATGLQGTLTLGVDGGGSFTLPDLFGVPTFLSGSWQINAGLQLQVALNGGDPTLNVDGTLSITGLFADALDDIRVSGSFDATGVGRLVASLLPIAQLLTPPAIDLLIPPIIKLGIGGVASGLSLLGEAVSELSLSGQYSLTTHTETRTLLGEPVTVVIAQLQVDDAAVSWADFPAFQLGSVTIDSGGNFDAVKQQQQIALDLPLPPGVSGVPAMQLTIPAYEVHVHPDSSTFQLKIVPTPPIFFKNQPPIPGSDPSLTIPGISFPGGLPLDIPTITINQTGDFTQPLAATDLDLAGVLHINGSLVFERKDGVFDLAVRGTTGYVYGVGFVTTPPQLSIIDPSSGSSLFNLNLDEFAVYSDGQFDVDATTDRLGPDLLGIRGASISLHEDLSADSPQVLSLSLKVDGGTLYLPTGDTINLPDLSFDANLETDFLHGFSLGQFSTPPGALANLHFGLGAGMFQFSLNNADTNPFTINVPWGSLSLTNLYADSSGTFTITGSGELTFFGQDLGTATFSGSRLTDAEGDDVLQLSASGLNLNLSKLPGPLSLNVNVGGWIQTDGDFSFNWSNNDSTQTLQSVTLGNSGITITFATSHHAEASAIIGAVNLIPGPPPNRVVLNLNGFFTDVGANPPAGVTLEINGNGQTEILGGSPALTVGSGTVIVTGVTFVTATDSPTILVTGGNLKLRQDTIEQINGGTQSAIMVDNGNVDLGTASDSGGNHIDVNGTGEFIRNLSSNPVSTTGTVFSIHGSTVSLPAQSQTSQLRHDYGFFFTGDYYQDYHGLDAKWIKDRHGQWYALFTDGSLKSWTLANGQDAFAPIAVVDPSVWNNPEFLLEAPETLPQTALDQLAQLEHAHGFHFKGSYWQNYLGRGEKWFVDSQDNWFVVTTDGKVEPWKGGTSLGQSIATIDPAVWDNPEFLFEAALSPAALPQLNQLRLAHGFVFTGEYFEEYHQLGAKWFKDRMGQWCAVFADGSLKSWTLVNGQDTFTLIAQVDPSLWHNPELLFQEPLTLSDQALGQLDALQQGHGFHFAGSFWQNFLGQNEKWFQDQNGRWYVITPDGTIQSAKYVVLLDKIPLGLGDSVSAIGKYNLTLIATVDPAVWDDPNLLFHA
jgi:hypothetical protein